jgi:hypothetical protein
VTRTNCEGTRRLREAVSAKIGELLRGVALPAERRERMSRAAVKNNQARFLRDRWPGGWTAEEVALLGTDDDEAVAVRIGRSRTAVRAKRWEPGVGAYRYRKGPRGARRAR